MNRGSSTLLGVCLGLALGCSHTPPPVPVECKLHEPVPLALIASPKLNQNEEGRSLPTVIRILQLKDLAGLDKVDLQDLWDHEREQLGEVFLSVQEATLNPGQTLWLQETPLAEAKYFVAVALFRQPTGRQWLDSVPVPVISDRRCAEPKDAGPQPGPAAAVRFFRLAEFRIKGGL